MPRQISIRIHCLRVWVPGTGWGQRRPHPRVLLCVPASRAFKAAGGLAVSPLERTQSFLLLRPAPAPEASGGVQCPRSPRWKPRRSVLAAHITGSPHTHTPSHFLPFFQEGHTSHPEEQPREPAAALRPTREAHRPRTLRDANVFAVPVTLCPSPDRAPCTRCVSKTGSHAISCSAVSTAADTSPRTLYLVTSGPVF